MGNYPHAKTAFLLAFKRSAVPAGQVRARFVSGLAEIHKCFFR